MKSSEYTEEFPRKFRGNTKLGFLGISSEYTDVIPRKPQSVGIFRGNSEEQCVPRKKPMNSEEDVPRYNPREQFRRYIPIDRCIYV
ncbi:hypothetical protein F2Q69_00048368 [Brassica cretica]|uniref:Uncharacterized protein n=1 Tax=Brassica cretica TaxID=69181 RepID=A0A8S9PSW3_BRACR|nr:hypothetical protein F2Q69_00048368 [Brassica cretica]